MKLFLDTSVLLAGAGSARGASRFVLEQARDQEWELLTAQYCVGHVVAWDAFE
jgi:predicted nucleic acid-binding protein